MASPSPTDTQNKPLPVITLIPKDNDEESNVDDFDLEELPPIENSVALWSISPDSDQDEGEVEDEQEEDENSDGEDEDPDWDGDDEEEEETAKTTSHFDMPDFEEDDEDEDERSGMGPEGEDEEAEAGSDTEEMVRLIDPDQAKGELADYHPMIIVPTDEEVAALAMVVRDAKGNIIDDKHSNTFPWLTRFERARVIGTRATQLSHGAPPQINVPDGLIDSMKIAEIELENGQIPFIIRRPLPDGTSEYWPVNELQIL
jgi:DNA-directed RNA polymerase I, II, and III subunit RPABC2